MNQEAPLTKGFPIFCQISADFFPSPNFLFNLNLDYKIVIATIRHEKVGTKIWQRGKTDVARRDRQTDTVKRMPVEYARSNQTWSQTYGQTLNP